MENGDFSRLGGRLGLVQLLLLLIVQTAYAGSATWKTNAINSSWNDARNWTPETVPNGPDDVATFATSGITSIFLSEIEVSEIVFNPGASSFTITSDSFHLFTVSGLGIINNSGVTQQFIADQSLLTPETQPIQFTNSATAGNGTVFQALGGIDEDGSGGGKIEFFDSSSADHASIEIFDAAAPDEAFPGEAIFNPGSTAANASFIVHGGVNLRDPGVLGFDGATAAEAEITNLGGDVGFGEGADAGNSTVINQGPGATAFGSTSTAAQALITNKGGTSPGDLRIGHTGFTETATAGVATITNEGGNGAGAGAGSTSFSDTSTAGSATLIANAGVDGGAGASISFYDSSDGGTARFEVFGNATLDVASVSGTHVPTIGSLEGDGIVNLGANSLAIGSANSNTSFAGLIQGTGAVTKVGRGALTLSNANSFTGGMTLNQGALIASNLFGSATGAGPLQVNAGTLAGTGIIAGATTIGTGAFLAPAAGMNAQATLTIQSALSFNADATYTCTFKAKRNRVTTDKVNANGVTINSGAMILLSGQIMGALSQGLVPTVITNTSAHPIRGTFSNLPDGGIITIHGNNFQADYEGGTGNDLTLTVVQ